MTSQRVFTIAEVDALIPKLSELVTAQLALQTEIEQRLGHMSRLLGSVPQSLDVEPDDGAEVARLKSELRDLVLRYEAGWRVVQDMGAVVKDPQIGLLDFYGRIDGRLVWLCWRQGEDKLGFYHELEAGFSGRRPLGPETRAMLIN
jgi:hypothetical protein